MRVLVTGGAGFIGSHLVERLLSEGRSVRVIDDLSTGTLDNLAGLDQTGRLEVVVGRVEDQAPPSELFDDVDFVYHLAAVVGVQRVVESPLRTLRTNVGATEAVLAACAARGCPALLTSSSEVYGKSTRVPFSEDDDVVLGATSRGRWSYAVSKALDEMLALSYARERGLPVVVTRLFNAVGPRQTGRFGMVLPRFVARALAGEPVIVHGDGAQSRCFCHVHDTVEGIVRLSETPGAFGQVVNVGSAEETTILGLAERVVRRCGSSSPIELVPYERAFGEGFEDMRRRVPDLARVRALTGWAPSRSLDDIIDDVIAQHRSPRHGVGASAAPHSARSDRDRSRRR